MDGGERERKFVGLVGRRWSSVLSVSPLFDSESASCPSVPVTSQLLSLLDAISVTLLCSSVEGRPAGYRAFLLGEFETRFRLASGFCTRWEGRASTVDTERLVLSCSAISGSESESDESSLE